MSESDFTPKPQPLVFRIEISAEQASALAPLFNGTALPLPAAPVPAPISEEVGDARVLELKQLEQTLERREKDLVSYVDQLQGAMSGSGGEAAWWQRPAGGDGGVY